MRRNCVTTRVRIYYIYIYVYIGGSRGGGDGGGGGFRTGGTCVSFVVAAEGNNYPSPRCNSVVMGRVERVEGGKTVATRAKGIDNGPIISGRRRLSRHAPNSVEKNGRRTRFERKLCVKLNFCCVIFNRGFVGGKQRLVFDIDCVIYVLYEKKKKRFEY